MLKSVLQVRVILLISFLISVNACDPIHTIRYSVALSKNNNTDKQSVLFNIIDRIAAEHGMIKRYDNKESICRYYFGQYETQGLISSGKKDVSLKVAFDNKTNTFVIEITDLFRNNQSSFSKNLQADLENTIKQYSFDISLQPLRE